MREKPSKGYIDWALSRFGPEWVEAHLSFDSDYDSIETEPNSPDFAVEGQGFVDIRQTLAIPPTNQKRESIWSRDRNGVELSAFQYTCHPSRN